MGVTQEQVYLGDVISVDGKQTTKIEARKKKGLGTINQILDILQTVFFGKYYFEVAMVLSSSIAFIFIVKFWSLGDKDIRALEQTDEILL